VKRILILTAGFGEGHNSAARGIRAGLARVAPKVEVELRDLFPETFGVFNEIVRRAYLALINHWPKSWGYVYNWLDRKNDFDQRFQRFRGLKKNLGRLIDRFQPDAVVSTFPPYPYLLRQILGNDRRCKNVAVVTDSTAYLPDGLAEERGIVVVPLQVTTGERVTTSQPSPAAFAAAFAACTSDEIVAVHLSGALSGTVGASDAAGERDRRRPPVLIPNSRQSRRATTSSINCSTTTKRRRCFRAHSRVSTRPGQYSSW